ncbi:MAG: AMP-binding protein, partial [Actinomycetota bacterium]
MAEERTIEALFDERRTFAPHARLAQSANANDPAIYDRAATDFEDFWAEQARLLDWFRPWERVLEWELPFAKWFVGGRLNVSVNCLDRHVAAGGGDKIAYFFEGEPGDRRTITYAELLDEVCRFGNALRALGIQKGDRIAIYMPMIPELPVAMLACARIGAVHSVVFGGFSADALAGRIQDAEARLLVTADGGWRRGQQVPLKHNADEAVARCPSIEHVVVVQRTETDVPMQSGRDLWYGDLIAEQPADCEPEAMDAEDLLFTLYTSGTTAKPKGIVHTTGGYLTGVSATHRLIFDIKPDDVYWCAADIGWVTGHSYIVYGPLANHTTGILYEGAPDWPDRHRIWSIVERYRATILY